MTMLPAASEFTGASTTEGQFKTAITSQRAMIAELLGTDGSNKVAALTALGAVMNSGLSKSGAYTVIAADRGKVINCTGTFTLSVDAAATLGDGFTFAVLNSGSGTITIDPNASETIDGSTTKAIAAGKMVVVYCDGAKFSFAGSADGGNADTLDGLHAADMGFGLTAGDVYSTNTIAQNSDASATYVLHDTRRVLDSGTIRVGMEVKSAVATSQAVFWQIYKNNALIASGNDVSGAWVWKSVDTTCSRGDVFTFYFKSYYPGYTQYARNTRFGSSTVGVLNVP